VLSLDIELDLAESGQPTNWAEVASRALNEIAREAHPDVMMREVT